MKVELNPIVDKYLLDGCMRCKYGATPQCKVNRWSQELKTLRKIATESGLKEEIKWSLPVYTLNGKNVISVNALKESANITFFKGALMKDPQGILQQQGKIQAGRIAKFTNNEQIVNLSEALKVYIAEAISIEESGKKFVAKRKAEPEPAELLEAFDNEPAFKEAFYALTPGRQRGYILHFSQAKQSSTRKNRIIKYKQQILDGVGLHDQYNC